MVWIQRRPAWLLLALWSACSGPAVHGEPVTTAKPLPVRAGAQGPSPAGPRPVHHLKPLSTRTIPGGVACLIRLRELQIPFRSRDSVNGIDTPVQITGPISGIRYRSLGRRPLLCDCRLALALARASLILANLDVRELQFSSAYRYSRMSSGKLSRHGMGLALDVHRVLVGDKLLSVKADFARDLADGCHGTSPPLNRMACLFKRWRLFDRVLTPDFDRAHHNHFHLAILSLHRRRFPPRDGRTEPLHE